jgi:hypothetical protein
MNDHCITALCGLAQPSCSRKTGKPSCFTSTTQMWSTLIGRAKLGAVVIMAFLACFTVHTYADPGPNEIDALKTPWAYFLHGYDCHSSDSDFFSAYENFWCAASNICDAYTTGPISSWPSNSEGSTSANGHCAGYLGMRDIPYTRLGYGHQETRSFGYTYAPFDNSGACGRDRCHGIVWNTELNKPLSVTEPERIIKYHYSSTGQLLSREERSCI